MSLRRSKLAVRPDFLSSAYPDDDGEKRRLVIPGTSRRLCLLTTWMTALVCVTWLYRNVSSVYRRTNEYPLINERAPSINVHNDEPFLTNGNPERLFLRPQSDAVRPTDKAVKESRPVSSDNPSKQNKQGRLPEPSFVSPSSVSRKDTDDDDDDDEGLAQEVVRFASSYIQGRREAHQSADRIDVWKKRGVGYAWEQHRLVLAAVLPEPTLGLSSIRIIQTGNVTISDCDAWTIWVRVAGSEIFAGLGIAVPTPSGGGSCHWEFPLDLRVAGEYTVHVKLLVYNGRADVEPHACHETLKTDGRVPIHKYPVHNSMVGFKLYTPLSSCCEICARTPGCRHWMSPPLSIMLKGNERGCELFFDKESLPDERPSSRGAPTNDHRRLLENELSVPVAHGPPHNNPTAYFVGCGWSFWFTHDFACLDPDLDDAVPVFPTSIWVVDGNDASAQTTQGLLADLPLCQASDEQLAPFNQRALSTGRWVRLPAPLACHPMTMDPIHNRQFDIVEYDGRHPTCWHRDNLTAVGHQCFEFCATEQHKPWISPLKHESHWYGVYQKYNCRWRELTNTELQQCVDKRRIAAVQVKGKSIAAFLRQYVDQRLAPIQLYKPAHNNTDALTIQLDTFGLPHLLWHQSRSDWERWLTQQSPVPPGHEHYYLTGYLYSSEREPHVHAARSLQLSHLLQERLIPKGFRQLDAWELTAAFTFDTATQMDGLHVIGPPSKMIVTKFFHYICADVL